VPPTIFGDGEQSRDFTYVANAVHANLLAARSDKPLGGEVINVACGERVSVNRLAGEMSRLLGVSAPAVHKGERAGDVKHSLADLSKAGELLGYRPIVGFGEGLAATVQWYRTQTA
jgi:nucleoside-diphosphate-sugar epimerase